jgi:glutamate racemase
VPHIQNIIADSDKTLPIGVFDSGIGGLTVLKALQHYFPNESYIYVGDTARLPYGTKSPETVVKYAESLTAKILEKHVKAIVVACNTASTHALPAVQAMAGALPVIGMIDPAAAAAAAVTQNGHIGVMATYGTIKSGVYERAIHRLNPAITVSAVACQMLVALAEEGWAEGDIAAATIRRYLDPIFDQPHVPDTLVLGCTHFPVFEDTLRAILGRDVTLINSGEAASQYLSPYLDKAGSPPPPRTEFLVTDDPSRFAENAAKFFGHALLKDDVHLIDIR